MASLEEIRCLDAPLADKLAAYTNHLKEHNTVISEVYSSLVNRLSAANASSDSVKTNSNLPEFLLPDSGGELVHSTELLDNGPLVVSFNRGHWCSYCKLELLALSENYPAIKKCGGELVSVMPESAASIRQLKEELDLPFQVLTDIDNGYALSCGLMVSLGEAVREAYRDLGRNLADFHGNNAWFVPIPATFVVAGNGRISGHLVDVDFRHRMAPAEILKCLESIS